MTRAGQSNALRVGDEVLVPNAGPNFPIQCDAASAIQLCGFWQLVMSPFSSILFPRD